MTSKSNQNSERARSFSSSASLQSSAIAQAVADINHRQWDLMFPMSLVIDAAGLRWQTASAPIASEKHLITVSESFGNGRYRA